MPGVITNRFRIAMAQAFAKTLNANSAHRYFFTIGRVTAWPTEASPPTPTDTTQNTEFDVYRDMIAMKRVQSSDVTHVVPRYNWTTNTAYTQYSDTSTTTFPTSTDLTSNTTFYVMTTDNNVYKVVDNNRGGRSTTQPTGTGTSIISTADNYRWKFLYNITAADEAKWVSSAYVPVKTLSANDGSAQWTTQQAASNGSIHHITITANGTGYLTTTNTVSSVTNSSVLVLKSNASGTDDSYVGSVIYLSGGLGSGQMRKIVNYVGASKTATVNTAFSTTPNTSTTYIVSPRVIIRGDSGSTTGNRATAYVSNTQGGQVRKIIMVAEGTNYSTANVTISANSTHGSGAAATPILSPPVGHGKDPVSELGGINVMLRVQVSGTESNTFPANNDFRVLNLIRDPMLRGGTIANASVIDQCSRITVTSLSGDMTADEIITGGTSGAKARFVRFANTNSSGTAGIVRVIRLTTSGTGGYFSAAETITGATSGKTATVSSFIRPAVREHTGDILFTENRVYITRTSDQIEDIKLVVKF